MSVKLQHKVTLKYITIQTQTSDILVSKIKSETWYFPQNSSTWIEIVVSRGSEATGKHCAWISIGDKSESTIKA